MKYPANVLDDRHWLFISFHGTFSSTNFRAQHIIMIELEYVKKRKRKKFLGILAAVSTVGMGTLVLVSFLGRFVGTFTVSLNTGNVKLSLSEKSSFNSSSSFLRIDGLVPYGQTTFSKLPQADVIDSEESSYLLGAQYKADGETLKSLDFFKYTFYVKNAGSVSAEYNFRIKIIDNKTAGDGRKLDSLLRVMVYENDAYGEDHNYTVYAKASESPNEDEEGNPVYNEYISMNKEQAQKAGVKFPGFAEMFESSSVVATIPVKYFDQNNMKRYTIVTWLEGYDPQADGEAPEGANLQLGVEINAYENK